MEQDFESVDLNKIRDDVNENPSDGGKKARKYDNILGIMLAGLTFLLPLIFVSSQIVDFGSLKAFVFLIATYILIFVWTVTRLKKDKFVVPFNLITLAAIIVLVVNLASTFLSNNLALSFWGRDFGLDSFIYILTLFLFFFIGSFILKGIRSATYTYLAFGATAVLALVIHLLLILFPNIIPDLGYLFTNTTNTIGKWFDLGVFSGLVTILTLVSISLLDHTKRIRVALRVLLGLSLVVLALVGFVELWITIGVFSLVIFVYLLMSDRASSGSDISKIRIPISALVVLILSATIILSSLGDVNSINAKLHQAFDINFVDVRPSAEATFGVIKDSVIESPIIGKDFRSFEQGWIQYKPDTINLTDLWSADFRYGYGLIPSYLSTTGILGILAWLMFLGVLVYLGFSSIFRENNNKLSKYILVSSFFSSLFLWVMATIYNPSHVTLYLTFLFSAMFVGSLYRENIIKVKEYTISKSPKHGFVYIFFVVVLLIASITVSYNISENFVAQVYARQSLVALQQGDIDTAQDKIISALTYNQSDVLFKSLSDIQQIRALQIQNNPDLTDAERATGFESFISASIQSASAAVEFDNENYSNYYYIGDLFINLMPLQIEGVDARAIDFMNRAKELNPKNPEIPLALARIYLSQEDYGNAKELINESIDKKPNYTEAVYLLSQVNVAEGEIEKAIENVRTTTLIRPNDPVTYFQLGLLQYQNRDFNNAINSFETALTRNGLYANAKYFLGLSYYEAKRVKDAIIQFEQLEQLNPDNQEIKFILNNLRGGNAPFFGASNNIPPIDDEPESRNEPPLDDDTSDVGDDDVVEEPAEEPADEAEVEEVVE